MKIQILVALVISTLGLQTHARTIDVSQYLKKVAPGYKSQVKKLNDNPSDPEPVPPEEPAKPIRTAKGYVVINKYTFIQDSEGNYDHRQEEVCRQEARINVYDFINSDNDNISWEDFMRLRCTSKVNDKDVEISVGSFFALLNAPIYPNETATPLKAALGMLFVNHSDWSQPQIQESLSGIMASKELNSKSFITSMSPSVYIMCTTPGEPVPPETKPVPKVKAKVNDCQATHPVYFDATLVLDEDQI